MEPRTMSRALREDRTIRRRIIEHGPLFAHFDLRARAARAWLRQPDPTTPRGILLFTAPARA